MPRIGPVGLGAPFAAPQRGRVGRLGQMRHHPGPGQFLDHIPPPGTPLHRELDIVPPGEPPPATRPAAAGPHGAIWPARHLPGLGVEIVERDLLPVDVEPSYDGHWDLLKLRD